MSSSSEGQQISEICRNNEAYRKSAIKAADCDHKDSLKVIEEFQEVYRKRMKLLNEASDKSPELSEVCVLILYQHLFFFLLRKNLTFIFNSFESTVVTSLSRIASVRKRLIKSVFCFN